MEGGSLLSGALRLLYVTQKPFTVVLTLSTVCKSKCSTFQSLKAFQQPITDTHPHPHTTVMHSHTFSHQVQWVAPSPPPSKHTPKCASHYITKFEVVLMMGLVTELVAFQAAQEVKGGWVLFLHRTF